MFTTGMTPPLSPVLLAGLAARPLSVAVLQPVLDAFLSRLFRCHPDLFERLSCLGAPVYLIDPVDLPVAVVLTTDAENPGLRAVKSLDGVEVAAVIRGPLLALVSLLQGKIDGDALFFSRDLVIEGDTEAVVALRNAVDGSEIDMLEDITEQFGPLAGTARRLARVGQTVFERMAEDMSILHAALVAPTAHRVDAHSRKLREMDEKIDKVTAKSHRRQPQRAARV